VETVLSASRIEGTPNAITAARTTAASSPITNLRLHLTLSPFGGVDTEPGCVCSDLASPAIEAPLPAAGASVECDALLGLDVSSVILGHPSLLSNHRCGSTFLLTMSSLENATGHRLGVTASPWLLVCDEAPSIVQLTTTSLEL